MSLNKPEAAKILEAISSMMASSMDTLTPEDWLRISAAMALGTIDMLDTTSVQKRSVANTFCEVFLEGVKARMQYNDFMERLSPGSVN